MARELMNRQQNRLGTYEPYLSLRDAMSRLFEDSFISPAWFSDTGTFNGQALDIYETDNDIVVKVALPGVKPENLDVQVQGDQLIIDAKIPEQQVENATYHYRGMMSGEYHRQITLPVQIDSNKVEATCDNGVVTICLPKSEQVKPKRIQIKSANK